MSYAARRFRKPAVPTEADLAVLRRLVIRARRVANAPLDEKHRLRLQRTSDQARRAVLPIGHQSRLSAFVKLIALGQTWWRLSEADRRIRAAELAEYAGECDAALEAPSGPTRTRADIHG
ncbi:hypothetical protein [Phenylobacterium sp.]|uniref:hypothetical protein n=1 Tax=Phenylobacterium sp. TaxID=1871053 RepID=UPI00273618DB|nr:hypothetical protein [Phenylobacterium sp.]MDP3853169.1 hypothetical protein [Phenylobacterium sp.]